MIVRTDKLNFSEQQIVFFASGYESCPGIYFLLQDDEIVYVGKSADTGFRVATHYNQGEKVFNGHAVVEIVDTEARDYWEVEYIVRFAPRYNASLPPSKKWVTLAILQRMTGQSKPTLKRIIRNLNIKDTNGYYLAADFADLLPFKESDLL
jgi:excinuclease UvrABC nuclease subunit